jgi:NAD+ kinase
MVNTIAERIGRVKCVGVRLRPRSPDLKKYFLDLKLYLAQKGIETLLDERSAEMIDLKGVDEHTLYSRSDFLISIGGDGTLIALARRSFKYEKPILGVNLGNLGFLTDVKSDGIQRSIDRILRHDYRIDRRMIMQINAEVGGHKRVLHAINDLVIRHKNMKMVQINLMIDGVLANTYHGDALIVSTPTGATGYNLSAGGPVVFPYAKNFIFTPICPHSLTQRSLVLPTHFEIELSIEGEDGVLLIDGQDQIPFNKGDRILLSMSDSFVKMIHRPERNFFKVIREKLNWGEGQGF